MASERPQKQSRHYTVETVSGLWCRTRLTAPKSPFIGSWPMCLMNFVMRTKLSQTGEHYSSGVCIGDAIFVPFHILALLRRTGCWVWALQSHFVSAVSHCRCLCCCQCPAARFL